MNFLLNKKHGGIGLLELMLSLAIIAILLIMATRYYGAASRSEKVNAGVALVQSIAAAAASYKQNTNYEDISVAEIAQSGLIPKAYVNTAKDGINTPWPQVIVKSIKSVTPFEQVTVTISGFTAKGNDYAYACRNLQQKFRSFDAKCPKGGQFTVTFD